MMDEQGHWLDKIFNEACKKGEFDDLEGKGKPLNTGEYFNASPEDRMTFHILSNAGYVPEEIEIRKKIEQLEADLKDCTDLFEVKNLRKEIQTLNALFYLKLEHRRLNRGK